MYELSHVSEEYAGTVGNIFLLHAPGNSTPGGAGSIHDDASRNFRFGLSLRPKASHPAPSCQLQVAMGPLGWSCRSILVRAQSTSLLAVMNRAKQRRGPSKFRVNGAAPLQGQKQGELKFARTKVKKEIKIREREADGFRIGWQDSGSAAIEWRKTGECAHRGVADGVAGWIEYSVQGSWGRDSFYRAPREVTLLQSLIFRR